jgi:hypothetical protein
MHTVPNLASSPIFFLSYSLGKFRISNSWKALLKFSNCYTYMQDHRGMAKISGESLQTLFATPLIKNAGMLWVQGLIILVHHWPQTYPYQNTTLLTGSSQKESLTVMKQKSSRVGESLERKFPLAHLMAHEPRAHGCGQPQTWHTFLSSDLWSWTSVVCSRDT